MRGNGEIVTVGYTRRGKAVTKRKMENVGDYLLGDDVIYNLVVSNLDYLNSVLTYWGKIKLENYVKYRSSYVGDYKFRPGEFVRMVLNPLGYRVRFRVELERLEDEG